MNSFHKYYSGEKVAPFLTIFIGGNHEASNHLKELYVHPQTTEGVIPDHNLALIKHDRANGGWVCPNIYYLGHSGVVNYGGLRIAGLSGIFKGYHYRKGNPCGDICC